MRAINRLIAWFFGYFWLPCPICNKFFGGHEAADTSLMIDTSRGKCVCKNCEDEAKRRNNLTTQGEE